MDERSQKIAVNYFFGNKTALVSLDGLGCCIAANRAAENLFRSNFGREIRPGMTMVSIVPPDEYPEFTRALQLFSGTGMCDPILSIVRSDEGERWFESTLTPAGASGESVLSVMDITQEKKTIDRMSEREQRFRALVQNLAGIIVVTDGEGVISWISESSVRYLGYMPHECRRKNLSVFVHGKDSRAFLLMLENLAHCENVTLSSEMQFRTKKGDTLCFELDGINRTETPGVGGIIFNMRDVTERRNLDQISLRLARQNELILETAREGIFGVNGLGMVTFINPFAAEILGCRQEDIEGLHYSAVFTGVDGQVSPRIAEAIASTASCNGVETVLIRKDGTELHIEFSSTPMVENHASAGTVVTFNDISRRLKIEEELRRAKNDAEEANRAKSDFLALMSHEIRTPMTSVMGFIEMISMTELSDVQRDYLSIASSNARHLLELIRDILDISKIEKGKLELERIPFVPSDEVSTAVSFFRAQAERRKISLSVEIQESPVCVGDALRLRQIVANLVGNALKFTPENGTVKFSFSSDVKDSVCGITVSVSDSGIGMSKEQIAVLFNPFTQADASIARQYGGSGLGLSISARLVAMMGGEIMVESTESRGSRFYFTVELPFPGDAPVSRDTHLQPGFFSGRYALVAEDEEDSRKLVVLMMEKMGISCDIAGDGLAAYEKNCSGRYDLILMDGNMPVCDGCAAARMIRSREDELSLRRVPIIALSARALIGEQEIFLAAGMDAYLTKPFSFEMLQAAVSRFLSVPQSSAAPPVSDTDLSEVERVAQSLGIRYGDYMLLAGEFLSSLERSCDELDAAVDAGDASAVELVAHRIKGSAANFRFTVLAEICLSLEESAKRKDLCGFSRYASGIRQEAARCLGTFRRITGS